jgi:hypothetical protein
MRKIIPREQIKHLEWKPGDEIPEPPKAGSGGKNIANLAQFTVGELLQNGKHFYDAHLPTALRAAQTYTTERGMIATLPALIAGKASADKRSYLWKNWFAALSEEHVGIDKEGLHVPRGQPIVITLHGQGILTPERIEQAYEEGLTDYGAAVLTNDEFSELLHGRLPNGNTIDLHSYLDIQRENPGPFSQYGVVMPFEVAKATSSGRHEKNNFLSNEVVIIRTGLEKSALESYFDKAENSTGKVGNWHRYNEINPAQASGRLLYVNYTNDGLDGDVSLDVSGRFVGIAPEALGARV